MQTVRIYIKSPGRILGFRVNILNQNPDCISENGFVKHLYFFLLGFALRF